MMTQKLWLLRVSLEQAGYQGLVVYDGEAALHNLRRERPDLVVLDLMLPDRDGWDVTRVMRSGATLADTPISTIPPSHLHNFYTSCRYTDGDSLARCAQVCCA